MKNLAKPLMVIVLFTSSAGCSGNPDDPKEGATPNALPAGKGEGRVDIARPETTIEIRDPWNRGDALRVRLDIDRLRAHNLSKEDVMRALTPSSIMGDPKEPPSPPGVVFSKHHFRPDQTENVILKAGPEGDIARLKDVAKVELLPGREAQGAEPSAAADRGGN